MRWAAASTCPIGRIATTVVRQASVTVRLTATAANMAPRFSLLTCLECGHAKLEVMRASVMPWQA